MTDSLFFTPLQYAYTTASPEPFYSRYAESFSSVSRFLIEGQKIQTIALDTSDTYTLTPAQLKVTDGCVLIAKVTGDARLTTTAKDVNQVSTITAYQGAYGTDLLPGYIVLSTYNATAFVFTGVADDTVIELFFGYERDIVASNIGETVVAAAAVNTTSAFATAIDATANLSLTAGKWLITGSGSAAFAGSVTGGTTVGCNVLLTNVTDTLTTVTTTSIAQNTATPAAGDNVIFPWTMSALVDISVAKIYKVQLITAALSGSPTAGGVASRTGGGGLIAVRVGLAS